MSNPVTVLIRATDPDGFEVEIGLQGDNSAAALSTMASALAWLKAEKFSGIRTTNGSTPAASDQAGPPICEFHGPMKRSTKFEGWYCPSKMGDGSYCKSQQRD